MYLRLASFFILLISLASFDLGKTIVEQSEKFRLEAEHRCVRIETKDGGHFTGTIIAKDLILTNFHGLVVNSVLTIIFTEEKGVRKKVTNVKTLGVDAKKDLVLLKVTTPFIEPIKIQDSVAIWERVFYVGYPTGIKPKTSVQGSIIAIDSPKEDDGYIYSDIYPGAGMSGSGLYSLKTGKLVGIMSEMVGDRETTFHASGAVAATDVIRFLKECEEDLDTSFKQRIHEVLENK
jgi:S1-C subfamily serine protease